MYNIRPTEVSGKTHLHNKNKLQENIQTKIINRLKLAQKRIF